MLFCEAQSCYDRPHNDLERPSNLVLFIVSLFCAWNITTVEINSCVYLLKSYNRQVPLFTSGGLGHGLGIKNLVLFISLLIRSVDYCLGL